MVSGDGIVPGHPSQVTYMDDAMVAAAVGEAEAHGAFVTAHARSPDGVRLAVRNGVRIVHHATYLDDAAIAELTAARDEVWVCPGLHYLRAVVEGGAEPYGITRERVEDALYPEELQASIDGLRKLHSNGVRIVAGGDFGHQWTQHGTYAAELAAYVELLGFSPLEALADRHRQRRSARGRAAGPDRGGLPGRPRGRRRRPDRRRARAARPRARRPGRQGRRAGVRAGMGRRRRLGPGAAARTRTDEGGGRVRGRDAARGRGPRARSRWGRATSWCASRPAGSATPTST